MKKLLMVLALAFAATVFGADPATTLEFAQNEAVRLMSKAKVECKVCVSKSPYSLTIALDGKGAKPVVPSISAVKFDGYAISVSEGGYIIAARAEKGVLNGLYALAEKLGFAFVMPGEKGESAPAKLENLGVAQWTENPRFPRRGIFASSRWKATSYRDWYHFLAKLRFNSMCAHVSGLRVPDDDFAKLLGFRLEVGGHGMSSCLPRDTYETEPELFRMFQPEDFGGKRLKDSNFCASNPKTRKIVKENFKKKIQPSIENGYHAVHAWADDLPAGGWCMCSRCRAMTATDQSQYTMNLEAQAIREMGAKMRVPAIAYHDTMFPSWTIAPDPLCFLLFAPRERCYGHALNDPSCALNRHYLKALEEWTARYKGIDDSHTFEYYNDKLLYRGHTPYMPDVLIGDADIYEKSGIEAWMSLQVGGELLAPDWNMLAHSILAWESGHTRETVTRRIAGMLADQEADWDTWYRYLDRRASAYQTAFSVCDVPSTFYFDYRFMPERPSGNGGAKLIANQALGSEILINAFDSLERDSKSMKGLGAHIADLELKRCRFEKVDLAAMAEHQRGLVNIADYWNGAGNEAVKAAIKYFEKTISLLEEAERLCRIHDPKKTGQYYLSFVKGWSVPEIKNKIRVYSQELKDDGVLFKSDGLASEKTGWKLKRSEAGKIVYIPFEGYYESKGGRIESKKFNLAGAKYLKLVFTAKAQEDGLWWVDLFDMNGKLLPDINSRLYKSDDWKEYSVVVPVKKYAAMAQVAFVCKKGVSVKDVRVEEIDANEAAKWCDDFYKTLPQIKCDAPASVWDKLPKAKEKLLSGKPLRVVLLGDSIVNDMYCGNVSALVEREFPNVEFVISVRGSTGCWFYRDPTKFVWYVTRHNPDLVLAGGISNVKKADYEKGAKDMIDTINNAKKAGIEVGILSPAISYEWRKSPDDTEWNEDKPCFIGKGQTEYLFKRDYQRKAVAETNVAYWDITTAPCIAVSQSRKPINWFKRDAAHSDDRGKQLIARTLLEYFRAAKK